MCSGSSSTTTQLSWREQWQVGALDVMPLCRPAQELTVPHSYASWILCACLVSASVTGTSFLFRIFIKYDYLENQDRSR
jgi:hypothetical protein